MAVTYKVLKCKNPKGTSGVLYAADRAVKRLSSSLMP